MNPNNRGVERTRARYDINSIVRQRRNRITAYVVFVAATLLMAGYVSNVTGAELVSGSLTTTIFYLITAVALLMGAYGLAALAGYCMNKTLDEIVLEALQQGDSHALEYWASAYSAMKPKTIRKVRTYVQEIVCYGGPVTALPSEAVCNAFTRELMAAWSTVDVSPGYVRAMIDFVCLHGDEFHTSRLTHLSRVRPRTDHQIFINDELARLRCFHNKKAAEEKQVGLLVRPSERPTLGLLHPVYRPKSRDADTQELLVPVDTALRNQADEGQPDAKK